MKGTFCYEKKCYHLREGFPKEPLSKEKAALNQSVQGDGTFWVEEKGIYRDRENMSHSANELPVDDCM